MRPLRCSPLVLLLTSACLHPPPPARDEPPPPTSDTPASSAITPPAGSGSAAPVVAAPEPVEEPPPPRVPPTVQLFDGDLGYRGFFPRGDAFAQGLDGAALDELVREAEATKSDSLLVIHRGHVVVERYFGAKRGPIETMSVTKSLVSLAIGALLAEGKIASVDAPVSTWFPEWKEGDKAKVTLRHLLTHTSGLEHLASAQTLNQKKDRVAYARALPIVEPPGSTFSYSNEATALLSGIVAAAAKKPLDAYVKRKIFEPLGIKDYGWATDRAGTPQSFYGAALRARDLAKIGMLVLQRGTWEGKELLPAAWITESTSPGAEPASFYGLLWWIRYEPVKDGASPVLKPGTPIGFAADGWLGQYLAVYPAEELVAVRQHRAHGGGEDDAQKHGFKSFFDKLRRTFPAPARRADVGP